MATASGVARPTVLLRLMGLTEEEASDVDIREMGDEVKPDWRGVEERIRSHPEEAAVVIEGGSFHGDDGHILDVALCIHACIGYIEEHERMPVPEIVVRLLIGASPDCVTASAIYNVCGNPYLSEGVIESIFDHAVNKCTDLLVAKDELNDGDSPLHKAAQWGNIAAARSLIRRNPDSLEVLDTCTESNPLQWVCHTKEFDAATLETMKLLITAGSNRNVGGRGSAGGLLSRNGRGDLGIEDVLKFYSFEDPKPGSTSCWSKRYNENMRACMFACLQAAGAVKSGQSNDFFSFPLFHASIMFAPYQVISQVLAYLRGNDLATLDILTERDSQGKTPLEVALESFGNSKNACPAHRRFLLHLFLSGENGSAVAAQVSAEKGKLLFRIAAACNVDAGALRNVFRAHPGIIDCPDPDTGLLPFMQCAIMPSAAVDDVFFFLRARPNLVASGIRSTDQELYLERKLARAAKEHEGAETSWKRERENYVEEIARLKNKLAKMK